MSAPPCSVVAARPWWCSTTAARST
jgi:hypothetical protein